VTTYVFTAKGSTVNGNLYHNTISDSEDKHLLGKIINLSEGIRRLKYLC